MELAATEHFDFPALARLHRHGKLRGSAAISRTIQAWHMTHFNRPCTILPVIIDESIWFPDGSQRVNNRIGYLDEGPHTSNTIELLRVASQASGLNLEFIELRGDEADIRTGMQKCTVFLGMNRGKDPLWGEGCPLSTLESMFAGCVLIAFDVLGNREIVQHGFNGFLIPPECPDLMASTLIRLFKTSGEIGRLQINTLALVNCCHRFESRWPAVKEFLNLDDLE